MEPIDKYLKEQEDAIQDAYDEGYSVGVERGKNEVGKELRDAYIEGYEVGVAHGWEEGFDQGYSEGHTDAENGQFL